MLDWFIETRFIYLLGLAAMTIVGLLLVWHGLWGDLSKGRTRCPKCWYDMRGSLPKLECPECGHDAREERRLRKHHRRWGRIVIGVPLVLLSAYPLSIIAPYWREQSVLWRIGQAHPRSHPNQSFPRRWNHAGMESIGAPWDVERLPYGLDCFYQRRIRLSVDDAAQLAACRSLRYLRYLTLSGIRFTDADLVHLKGLSKLERLNLSQTRLTNAALVHLKGLSQLKHLDLSGMHMTGAGLVHLKGLSKLKKLKLYGTLVPGAAVAKLKQALPNLDILR